MSTEPDSIPSADVARRRIIAIAGAGASVLAFVLAFAFSGPDSAPKVDDEPDAPLLHTRRSREGIPLRTDIPAGTSPLQKQGADTPLFQRPEASR